jgi:hypothetical protein
VLVFIDESGDPGRRFERGSSAIFLIALVAFSDHQEAQACDDAIESLRGERGLGSGYEFHFGENSFRVKQLFLDAVKSFAFETHIFALDKRKVTGPTFESKTALYRWAAQKALRQARPHLNDARVMMDDSGDRQFQHELTTYLKREANVKLTNPGKAILSIRSQHSAQNNLLQLADYVASATARHLTMKSGKDRAAQFRITHLAAHELTFQLWPEGKGKRATP